MLIIKLSHVDSTITQYLINVDTNNAKYNN